MIPVHVLTGFLGAGKTTFATLLLQHCLQQGERPVYIVNEFGKAGLDAEIVRHEGFHAVELAGGCVCCTLKTDLVVALRQLVEKYAPSRILFEPSGIFVFDDFSAVFQDPFLHEHCRLESVIAIVDCLHIDKTRRMAGGFFAGQLAHAQHIVFSKRQFYTGTHEALVEAVRPLNARARLLAKPWDALRGEELACLLYGEAADACEAVGDAVHEHGHGHDGLQAITLEGLPPCTHGELQHRLQLWQEGFFGDVCRIKGVLCVQGRPMRLNAAFTLHTLEPCACPDAYCVTFIGAAPNQLLLRAVWTEEELLSGAPSIRFS